MSTLRSAYGSNPSDAARGAVGRDQRRAAQLAEQQRREALREPPVRSYRRTDVGMVVEYVDGSSRFEPHDSSSALECAPVEAAQVPRPTRRPPS